MLLSKFDESQAKRQHFLHSTEDEAMGTPDHSANRRADVQVRNGGTLERLTP